MLSKFKFLIFSLAVAVSFSTSTSGAMAVTNPFNPVCNQEQFKGSPVCKAPEKPLNPAVRLIRIATGVLATATGLLAVVFIMIGGFNLITSGGNPENVKKGRQQIIYSLVGIVIAVLAWTITNAVINVVTK